MYTKADHEKNLLKTILESMEELETSNSSMHAMLILSLYEDLCKKTALTKSNNESVQVRMMTQVQEAFIAACMKGAPNVDDMSSVQMSILEADNLDGDVKKIISAMTPLAFEQTFKSYLAKTFEAFECAVDK